MSRLVAMIPARLGSKRVAKKNLRMLGDKPLVAHIIETALASNVLTRSTSTLRRMDQR